MQSVTQTVVTGIIKKTLKVSELDTVSLVEQSSQLLLPVVMTELPMTLQEWDSPAGLGVTLGLWGCSP